MKYRMCWKTPEGTVHRELPIFTKRQVKKMIEVWKADTPRWEYWIEDENGKVVK